MKRSTHSLRIRNVFSVTLDDELAEILIRYCGVMDYAKTDVIRRAIESYLGDVIPGNIKLLIEMRRKIRKDGGPTAELGKMIKALKGRL